MKCALSSVKGARRLVQSPFLRLGYSPIYHGSCVALKGYNRGGDSVTTGLLLVSVDDVAVGVDFDELEEFAGGAAGHVSPGVGERNAVDVDFAEVGFPDEVAGVVED